MENSVLTDTNPEVSRASKQPNTSGAEPSAETDVDQLVQIFDSSVSLRETRETYL